MKSYIDDIIVMDTNGEDSVLYPRTKQEAVEGLQERLSNIELPNITTTDSTTQPNSYAGREMVLEIGGVTEQETTAGNQLYDNSIAIVQGGINQSGSGYSSEGYLRVNGYIPVSGTSVTVACNIPIYRVFRYSGTTNDSFISYLHAQSATELTVPLTEDTAYIRISFVNEDTTVTDATIETASSTLMVNYGDVALPYEQYTGGQPAPNPSYPMEIKKSVVKGIKTHGRQLLDLRNGNSDTKEGVTFTNNGDGSYALTGTATGNSGNMWFLGGYNKVPASDDSNVILTLYKGRSYYISDCNLFTVKGGNSSSYKGLVIPTYDIKVTGVRNPALTIDKTYNENIYPMVIEGDSLLPWEPYTSSEYTFSQPIELYGIGDVITPKEIDEKFTKRIFDGSENWKTSISLAGRYYVDNMGCKHFGIVFCTYAKGLQGGSTEINECYISTANQPNGRFLINTSFSTVDEWKAHLQANPMTVVYELAEETTEALPIADQIGLNSLATYDGITYVEFIYDELEPTFKGKYGTSEVGGYTLESLLTARNNELKQELANERLSALEASVVNNI